MRTGRRRSDGSFVAVVLEVTEDGYIGVFRTGVDDSVVFDTIEVSKIVKDLRELQAIALQGVRWTDI